MATLTQAEPRAFDQGNVSHVPMIGADVIYEGAIVGDNASGYARPLAAPDPFLGVALETVDNSLGADGDLNVKVQVVGQIVLPVVGATGPGDIGALVYATDDNLFTLTAGGNSAIGRVWRHETGTQCVVSFAGAQQSR